MASTIVQDDQGNQVSISEFVNFDPERFLVNLQQAFQTADAQGKKNIQSFVQNFQRSGNLASQNLQTEISGLESFLPRSSKLIRQADAEGNALILQNADVFDARNERATRRATEGNVALREDLISSRFPSLFSSVNKRLNTPLASDALRDTAARSSRNQAADLSTAGGFGINSAAARNLIDTFDFNKRLEIDALNRDDARASTREAQDLFTQTLAPGIIDFQPLQAQPRVTDIGSQIRPTPTIDAGSIQRQLNSELTPLTTISPTTALEADLSTQQYNSGVGLQALGFQQDIFNTISAAENNLFDKTEQSIREQIANNQFGQGLDAREQSQNIQGITGLVTSILSGGAALLGADVGAGGGGIGGLVDAIFGGGGGEAAAVGADGLLPSGLPPAATTASTTGGAAGGSGAGASSLATPLAMLAVAITSGKELYEVYQDWQDGDISSTDVKKALADVGAPSNIPIQGLNELVGKPLNNNDLSNALLLSNPITAPVAVASILGVDVGFGSGKSKQQKERDSVRDAYKEAGLISNNYQIKLADGSTFDIGKDGKAKLENKDGTTRHYYDVDFTDPANAKIVGWTNPLSVILTGSPDGNKLVGHLTNAVTNKNPGNKKAAQANAKGIALDAGITYDKGVKRLDAMKGSLPDDVLKAYRAGWYDLHFGG